MTTTSPGFRVGTRQEALAVDRPVEQAGRGDEIGAQGREEGERPPATMRYTRDQTPAARSPSPSTMTSRHSGTKAHDCLEHPARYLID